MMRHWIIAYIAIAFMAILAHFLDATPWSVYDIFTANALFAIFLKLKD